MKTILLCGGFGTRIRDVADDIPKPLVQIGGSPILWHLLKYYASFGNSEFILCLGYKSDAVVGFFANQSGKIIAVDTDEVKYHEFRGPINNQQCNVKLVETGVAAMTGARLKRVESLVQDETFMLNYGDGLSDVNLDALNKHHKLSGRILTVTGVRPPSRFGELQIDDENKVVGFNEKPQASGGRISGGFFVCQNEVFDYLNHEEDLVFEKEPIQRLVKDSQMSMYPHDNFWQCMDTYRDWELLNQMFANQRAPWLR